MINTPPSNVVKAVEDGTAFITRRLEFYEADGVTRWYPEGISAGEGKSRLKGEASVTLDANRDERRMFDAALDNSDNLLDPNPWGGFWYDKILKPFKGARLQDGTVWDVQVGEYMIDKIDTVSFPFTARVSCRDYAKKMMGSKFTNSASFPSSTKLSNFVKSLAANAGITKVRIPDDTPTLGVEYQVERGTSRWTSVKDVCLSKSYDVYFDNEGYLVIEPLPDPALDAVEVTFKTGKGGNLSSYSKSAADTSVYNHIVVIGERESESSGLPYFGEAINNDPASPTCTQKIGLRMADPIILSTISSDAEAARLARNILKVSGLESYNLDGSSISYPWIDVNVVALVNDPKAPPTEPKRFLLDSASFDLGPGLMSWTSKRITNVGGTTPPVDGEAGPVVTEPAPDVPVDAGTPVDVPEPTTPEPEPPSGAATTDISIATYNTARGATSGILAGLEKLAKAGADIICTQEHRRAEAFGQFLRRNKGWAAFIGPDQNGHTVTILWRKSLGTVTRKQSYLWVGPRYLGSNGGSVAKFPAKRGTEVDIKLGGGNNRTIQVINTHLIPGATKSKKTLGAAEYKRRRDHYSDHVAKLVQTVDARNGLVFTTGDYNAEPGFSLLDPLLNRVIMDHTFDTRMGRRIDYVTHRNHNAITVVARQRFTTTSDHFAVMVTYRIKAV